MGKWRSSVSGWRLAQVLVMALALANSGCLVAAIGGVAAAGGAAGYAYYKGGLAKDFNASLDTSWAAAKASAVELGMPVVAEKREKDGGIIDVKAGDGQTVRINFETLPVAVPTDGPRTDVSVRAGLFGDRALSERVIAQIASHLEPQAAASPAPGTRLVPVPRETAPPPAQSTASPPAF
jgi:hypothetical protein